MPGLGASTRQTNAGTAGFQEGRAPRVPDARNGRNGPVPASNDPVNDAPNYWMAFEHMIGL